MATRLYISNAAPEKNSFTIRGTWTYTTGSSNYNKLGAKAGAAATLAPTGQAAAGTWSQLIGRWVSDRLAADTSFTTSDTFNAVIGAKISSTSSSGGTLKVHVYVTSGNTDSQRGVLVDNNTTGTAFTATSVGRTITSAVLSNNVSALKGDRIVVEVGWTKTGTTTSARTGTINYGNTGGTDLTSGSTSTTTNPGWVEFSNTFSTAAEASPTVTLSSPNDAATINDNTPDLTFTGTDTNGDDLRYEVQIATGNFTQVSMTNLDSGNANGTISSQLTNSKTPTGNRLQLLSVDIRNGNSIDPSITSVTGCGLTWVEVDHIVYDTTSTSRRSKYLFRALGASPTTGQLTINFAEAESDVTWSWDEAANVDTSGTNGSGAIVQSVKTKDETLTATSLTLTLASFSNSNNATFATFGTGNDTDGHTVGSGFTLLGNAPGPGVNGLSTVTEWKNTNDTSADMTFTSGVQFGGIAVEIKAVTQMTADKISGTDAGFSGSPDNSDPFTSGQAVTYTVQSALPDGTYYWRVAAIDPTGSNVYGAWATARSFVLSTSTVRTMTGTARITATTQKTESGTARITATTTKTSTGTAKISTTTQKTETGTARIKITATKTETGTARITVTTQKTESGTARIQISSTKTESGTARISTVSQKTSTGIARITSTSQKTETGIARIQTTVPRIETGTARITSRVTRTETGVARITATAQKTETGTSRITSTTVKTKTGISRIQTSPTRTEAGIARIQKTVTQAILGTASIEISYITTTKIESATARIQSTTQKDETALARITTNSTKTLIGIARIQKSATQTELGVARISVKTTQTETGTSRITSTYIQTMSGTAKIEESQITTKTTLTGTARIMSTYSKECPDLIYLDDGSAVKLSEEVYVRL